MIPEWMMGLGLLNIAMVIVTGTFENKLTTEFPFLQTLIMVAILWLITIGLQSIRNYRDQNREYEGSGIEPTKIISIPSL